MKKSMKKLFTILFVLLFACKIFAAEGVVTFVKGKVEVKRGNSWVSLKVGDKVAQSEVINTGFQSEAKVKLMNNVLYLGPVTRVTLSTLSSSNDKDKVNVYLSTGTIRSKINRTDTKRVSYTVRTPIAVASVRGTDIINYGPRNFSCMEGEAAYTNIERLSTPRKSSSEEKKGEDKDKSKDEFTSEELEKIINDNIEAFADGEDLPGGEKTITRQQNVYIDNTLNLDNGSSDVEKNISETTSKVSSTSNKESTKTEAPASSNGIVEEKVTGEATGTLILSITTNN